MTGLVRIRIVEGRDIGRRLDRIRRGMEDRRGFHRKLGNVLETDIERNFKLGRDAEGRRLRPLKPETLQKRQEQGISSRRVLIRTGALSRSFKTRTEKRGRRKSATVIAPDKRQLAKGTAHQFGRRAGRGRKRLPIRAFLGISQSRQRFVEQEWLDHHQDQLKKHTRR